MILPGKLLGEVWGKLEVNVKGNIVARACSGSPSNKGLCSNCNPSLFPTLGVRMQQSFDIIMLGFATNPSTYFNERRRHKYIITSILEFINELHSQ
jgi:hypothetical protein